VQIMAKHKESIMKAAVLGVEPTRDTFILSSDVYKKGPMSYMRSIRMMLSLSACGLGRTVMLFFFSRNMRALI
jgi:hypothetical protein